MHSATAILHCDTSRDTSPRVTHCALTTAQHIKPAMVDPSARARVALPRIPPWTAPTPAAVAKAAEAQKRREEGKKDGGAAADAVTGKDKEKQKENGTAGAAGGAAAVNGNGGGSAGEKKGGSVTGRELEGLVGAR